LVVVFEQDDVGLDHRLAQYRSGGGAAVAHVPEGSGALRRRCNVRSAARRSDGLATRATAAAPSTRSATAVEACMPTPKPSSVLALAVPASARPIAACRAD